MEQYYSNGISAIIPVCNSFYSMAKQITDDMLAMVCDEQGSSSESSLEILVQTMKSQVMKHLVK